MPEADLVRIQASDLELASGTLAIRRGLQRRVIYLDEVTAALVSQWLGYRHQRWPGSRNPHLLVSQQTAADVSPVGPTMIWHVFEPIGVRPVRLRQDRILDEARHTADPVHLVRVFGITESTAMSYVHAAHRDGRSDDHVSELGQQVIASTANPFPAVQPVHADERLGHLADLLRQLQQPHLGRDIPVTGIQLANLIPHGFLRCWDDPADSPPYGGTETPGSPDTPFMPGVSCDSDRGTDIAGRVMRPDA